MPHVIVFYVFPDFQLLDLTGPLAAFHAASEMRGGDGYRLEVASERGGRIMSTAGLDVESRPLTECRRIDTLIVAGGSGTRDPESAGTRAVADAAGRALRIASVCTGAFILAEAGLLVGRRVTTHWRYAGRLQARFPEVIVDGDCIFVEDGPIWTSAGITAGIDLALALIETDFDNTVARAVAQDLVVYHRRPGGQSQFSAMLDLEPCSERVRRALSFARSHLAEPLSVEMLADAACVGSRQFARIFRAETGETPARAIERLRAEVARQRVEAGSEAIEGIAESVGFGDPERMRRAFLRLFGQPPQALRRFARADRMGVIAGANETGLSGGEQARF